MKRYWFRPSSDLAKFRELFSEAQRVVILTGEMEEVFQMLARQLHLQEQACRQSRGFPPFGGQAASGGLIR